MERLEYQRPEVEIVELNYQNNLLVISDPNPQKGDEVYDGEE